MEDYHIYDQIGTGSTSTVFKARKRGTLEYVAVKRVPLAQGDQARRLVSALTAAGRHPNILRFVEWHSSTRNVYLVLEYAAGGNLTSISQQDGGVPEAALRLYAADLLSALLHLHTRGLLLCDLQLSGVQLTEDGTAKLSCLHRCQSYIDPAQAPIFTGCRSLHTVAPELLAAAAAAAATDTQAPTATGSAAAVHTRATDLWALGCVLYELATGVCPFGGADAAAVADAIICRTPPPLMLPVVPSALAAADAASGAAAAVRAPASPELQDFVLGLLCKDPAARLQWRQALAHPWLQPAVVNGSLPPPSAADALPAEIHNLTSASLNSSTASASSYELPTATAVAVAAAAVPASPAHSGTSSASYRGTASTASSSISSFHDISTSVPLLMQQQQQAPGPSGSPLPGRFHEHTHTHSDSDSDSEYEYKHDDSTVSGVHDFSGTGLLYAGTVPLRYSAAAVDITSASVPSPMPATTTAAVAAPAVAVTSPQALQISADVAAVCRAAVAATAGQLRVTPIMAAARSPPLRADQLPFKAPLPALLATQPAAVQTELLQQCASALDLAAPPAVHLAVLAYLHALSDIPAIANAVLTTSCNLLPAILQLVCVHTGAAVHVRVAMLLGLFVQQCTCMEAAAVYGDGHGGLLQVLRQLLHLPAGVQKVASQLHLAAHGHLLAAYGELLFYIATQAQQELEESGQEGGSAGCGAGGGAGGGASTWQAQWTWPPECTADLLTLLQSGKDMEELLLVVRTVQNIVALAPATFLHHGEASETSVRLITALLRNVEVACRPLPASASDGEVAIHRAVCNELRPSQVRIACALLCEARGSSTQEAELNDALAFVIRNLLLCEDFEAAVTLLCSVLVYVSRGGHGVTRALQSVDVVVTPAVEAAAAAAVAGGGGGGGGGPKTLSSHTAAALLNLAAASIVCRGLDMVAHGGWYAETIFSACGPLLVAYNSAHAAAAAADDEVGVQSAAVQALQRIQVFEFICCHEAVIQGVRRSRAAVVVWVPAVVVLCRLHLQAGTCPTSLQKALYVALIELLAVWSELNKDHDRSAMPAALADVSTQLLAVALRLTVRVRDMHAGDTLASSILCEGLQLCRNMDCSGELQEDVEALLWHLQALHATAAATVIAVAEAGADAAACPRGATVSPAATTAYNTATSLVALYGAWLDCLYNVIPSRSEEQQQLSMRLYDGALSMVRTDCHVIAASATAGIPTGFDDIGKSLRLLNLLCDFSPVSWVVAVQEHGLAECLVALLHAALAHGRRMPGPLQADVLHHLCIPLYDVLVDPIREALGVPAVDLQADTAAEPADEALHYWGLMAATGRLNRTLGATTGALDATVAMSPPADVSAVRTASCDEERIVAAGAATDRLVSALTPFLQQLLPMCAMHYDDDEGETEEEYVDRMTGIAQLFLLLAQIGPITVSFYLLDTGALPRAAARSSRSSQAGAGGSGGGGDDTPARWENTLLRTLRDAIRLQERNDVYGSMRVSQPCHAAAYLQRAVRLLCAASDDVRKAARSLGLH